MIITSKEIMALFDVSAMTLTNWKRIGASKALIKRNQWDLKIFISWWAENIAGSSTSDDGESIQQAKVEYWRAKGQRERLKADTESGSLVSLDWIKEAWAWRVAEISNGLAMLPMRLPPLLEGKSQKAMRLVIDKEQSKLRENFSRKGKFCPVVGPQKKPPKRRK